MKTTRDELEFALSQYHDGTLPPLERRALDEVLASDPIAREILAEYQRLDALVKRASGPPELNWKLLGSQISASLESEDTPVRHYQIGDALRWAAVAAAILIMIGVVVPLLSRTPETAARIAVEISPPGGSIDSTQGLAQVDVVDRSHTASVAVAEVTIGPSPSVASAGMQYNDVFMTRPSHLVIAVSADAAQEMPNPAPF